MHQRFKDETEQAAYDSHNLKGQLKQQLTAFVAIAARVHFNAPTVEKNRKTMFVNAADEKQGAIWKACFRAGEAPTAAAIKLAKAWLLSCKRGVKIASWRARPSANSRAAIGRSSPARRPPRGCAASVRNRRPISWRSVNNCIAMPAS
jgi:hypothetical protein